ncbi:MAG: TOPRIM nucleotidyl transferase/hydrolase domain-containing protein [Acidimicrobiia bacterium]
MKSVEAVVLVEGVSDQVALEALAGRLGRNLEAEGVSVMPMGGAAALGEYLDRLLGVQGFEGTVAGLCDKGEVADFQRGLERAGLGTDLSRSDMEALGFYVCVVDLEDELIRALGVDSVERVIESQGELGAFRTLQNQPPWRTRASEEQLRRFFGAGSGRKTRYGRLLVDALDLTRVPRPLEGVLTHV